MKSTSAIADGRAHVLPANPMRCTAFPAGLFALLVAAAPASAQPMAPSTTSHASDTTFAYHGIVPGVTLDSLTRITRAFAVADSACVTMSAGIRVCQSGHVEFADSGSARVTYMEVDTATSRVVTLFLDRPVTGMTVEAAREAFTKSWGEPTSVPTAAQGASEVHDFFLRTDVGRWDAPHRQATVSVLPADTPSGPPTLRVHLTDNVLFARRGAQILAAIERETLRYRGIVAGITLDSLRNLTERLTIADAACFAVGAARICASGSMTLRPDNIRARFLGLKLVRMFGERDPEWTVADFTMSVPAAGHTRETAREALEAVWGPATDTQDQDYGDRDANALLAGTRIGAWETTFQKIEASFFRAERGEPPTLSITMQDKSALARWYAARKEPVPAAQRAPIAP